MEQLNILDILKTWKIDKMETWKNLKIEKWKNGTLKNGQMEM